jgi:hypothetical protein
MKCMLLWPTVPRARKSVRLLVWRSSARMVLTSWIEGKHSGEKDSTELQIVDLQPGRHQLFLPPRA